MGGHKVCISPDLIRLYKLDGTEIMVNIHLIAAFMEDKGIMKILIGNQWIDIKETKNQLISKFEVLY